MLSLICFALSRATPSDPVAQRIVVEGMQAGQNDPAAYERTYRRLAKRMGYDLPPFYFSVYNGSVPDTLHRIMPKARRQTVRRLAYRYGDWPRVAAYYAAVRAAADTASDDALLAAARRLLLRADAAYIRRQLASVRNLPAAGAILQAHDAMVGSPRRRRLLLPRLVWHGRRNQYHRYLAGILRGDLGLSYTDGRPVREKLATALPRTARLNAVALAIVYLLAVPLGLYMAYFHGSAFDRWATFITFLAFGLPAFWIATLLANFFTTPAFGMDWFGSMGFGNIPADTPWWEALGIRFHHLALPVFCLVYPSLAYVSRHLRSAALEELQRPYVQTAYMKGLAGSSVLWGHVFRNAAFPLVTLLGGLLPALLAGSVLIEQIFNLPGMGRLLFEAATARDWPVVLALVLVNGAFTVLGLLLADIGYALLDPRVRLGTIPPR